MTNVTAVGIRNAAIDWPAAVPISTERVRRGSPAAATIVLADGRDHQLGVWRVSTGEFVTEHPDYVEYIHIIEGFGRLVGDDDTTTELAPGTTVFMPVGWKGRWVVTAPIVKVFTIIHTDAGGCPGVSES